MKLVFKRPEQRRRVRVLLGIRLGAALVLTLIWHFAFAAPGRQADLLLLLLAALQAGVAWIQYLKMDGWYDHGLVVRRKPDAPSGTGRMMDYVDTEPGSDIRTEEKQDRRLISFAANLLGAIICLAGAGITGYFG